jgi:uncharacterized membrane protein AbrB (regulator of aidB expression)
MLQVEDRKVIISQNLRIIIIIIIIIIIMQLVYEKHEKNI